MHPMEDRSPQQGPEPSRRSWLETLAVGLGALATLALALPVVGYVLGTFFRPKQARKDAWVDVGAVGDFPPNETRLTKPFVNPHMQPWDGKSGKTVAYVRCRGERDFLVFAVNCTHLGCPVSWFPQSGLFLCPCHGGAYYEDGAHASGPPPRGLYRYDWKIENERLWILAGHVPTLQAPPENEPKERT